MAASAGGIRAGRAFVEVFADTSALSRGLNAAQAKLAGFGSAVTSFGSKLLGVGTAGVAAFALPVVKAGDFGETVSKFETVFGESSGSVRQWSEEFAERVGRSKAELLKFLADTRGLIDPLGFDPSSADEMSKTLTELAVDLASFNNTSDEEAATALKAGLLGESEPLKRFGIIVNETAAKAQAALDGVDWENATQGQKALARWQVIQNGAGKAVGDATRTADSFANKMKALQGNVDDAAIAVGSALIPALTPLVAQVADVAKKVGAWAAENPDLISTVAKVAAGIAVAGGVLTGFGLAISAFAPVLGLAATALGWAGAAAAALVSPVGLVTAGVIAGAAAFLRWTDTGREFADSVVSGFATALASVKDVVGSIGEALMSGDLAGAGSVAMAALNVAWSAGVLKLTEVWVGFKGALQDGAVEAMKAVMDVFNLTTDDLADTWGSLQAMWVKFTTFLADAWDVAMGGMGSAWTGTQNVISKGILELMGLFDSSLDVDAAKAALDEDAKRAREQSTRERNDRIGARDQQARDALAGIKADQDARRQAVKDFFDKPTRDAAGAAQVDEAAKAFAAAKKALDDARQSVDDSQAADASAALAAAEAAFKGTIADKKGGTNGEGATAIAKQITGTFSSERLGGLGAGKTAAEKTAVNTETTNKKLDVLITATQANRPVSPVFGT